MIETTLALIKPDAVRSGNAGAIISIMETHLTVCDVLCMKWGSQFFEMFYAEHKGKPFFDDLVSFMMSDRIYAITLVGDDAVKSWREVMGPTDPKKAMPDTVRGAFGSQTGPIMWNAVHGSDSPQRAQEEIGIIKGVTSMQAHLPHGIWIPFFGGVAEDVVRAAHNDELMIHSTHCCQIHGCKYDEDEECPVVRGTVLRVADGGWCQEPNLVGDPELCRRGGERMPGPDYHE